MDATGLESSAASRHYTQARSRAQKRGKQHTYLTYREFPKIGVLCDCTSHVVLAVVHDKGPSCDVRHFREAFDQARRRIPIQRRCWPTAATTARPTTGTAARRAASAR
ncbi:hypothetical protein KOR34_05130 [Posidoniimonas corsicana]|uniref:Transposase IS4-like domain-containing protein n=1 Tax=Posidoniimonas corsicana TaxID=1938618 RepID=A0A5C5VCP2_9BACT|nr:hypothetical protein [Posidoniimonas corsicana]TWT35619.1 hypothetical protein KOR34_05130 [Posidoniimonas corsicana]